MASRPTGLPAVRLPGLEIPSSWGDEVMSPQALPSNKLTLEIQDSHARSLSCGLVFHINAPLGGEVLQHLHFPRREGGCGYLEASLSSLSRCAVLTPWKIDSMMKIPRARSRRPSKCRRGGCEGDVGPAPSRHRRGVTRVRARREFWSQDEMLAPARSPPRPALEDAPSGTGRRSWHVPLGKSRWQWGGMPPLSEGLCQGGLFSESQRRDYGQAAGRGKPRGLGSQGPSAGGGGGAASCTSFFLCGPWLSASVSTAAE